MRAHKFVCSKTEMLDKVPGIDENPIYKENGELKRKSVVDMTIDGLPLESFTDLVSFSHGRPDDLERLLMSGALSEIKDPWLLRDVLKGKAFVRKVTTVEYTVIDGGSEEFFQKFQDPFMQNPDDFHFVGSTILTKEEAEHYNKKK